MPLCFLVIGSSETSFIEHLLSPLATSFLSFYTVYTVLSTVLGNTAQRSVLQTSGIQCIFTEFRFILGLVHERLIRRKKALVMS